MLKKFARFFFFFFPPLKKFCFFKQKTFFFFFIVKVLFLNLISEGHPKERVVCDYVGAMSDRFAIAKYEEIYIPKTWHI